MKLHRNRKLSLAAAATLAVAACSSGTDDRPPPAMNAAPVISAITDQAVDQDTVVGPIDVAITDADGDNAALMVAVSSDAATLFPSDGLVLGGSGGARTLTLTPFESRTGSATIAVIATDAAGASATRTFKVTVNARGASMKSTALDTFAKGEADEPTPLNGFTFSQDADDETTFAGLIPADAP